MSHYLLNVILPIFLNEVEYVFMALIFVIFIETFIIQFFIKQKFGFLFKALLFANIATTFFGYFLQGIFRFIVSVGFNIENKNPIIAGLTGNVPYHKDSFTPKNNLAVFTSIITSILFALFLSIYFERKILIRMYEGKVKEQRLSAGVKWANCISYSLLFIWVYMNLRHP